MVLLGYKSTGRNYSQKQGTARAINPNIIILTLLTGKASKFANLRSTARFAISNKILKQWRIDLRRRYHITYTNSGGSKGTLAVIVFTMLGRSWQGLTFGAVPCPKHVLAAKPLERPGGRCTILGAKGAYVASQSKPLTRTTQKQPGLLSL